MYDDPTPVHEDGDTMETQVNDELTWENVYSKPTEYLGSLTRVKHQDGIPTPVSTFMELNGIEVTI